MAGNGQIEESPSNSTGSGEWKRWKSFEGRGADWFLIMDAGWKEYQLLGMVWA